MHHALEVPEILLKIFVLDRWRDNAPADLAALARTCRAFKEPALDVLWYQLKDLSPLAPCLPNVSSRKLDTGAHAFTRQLTQAELDILQSYTRRVRIIQRFDFGFDWDSLSTPSTLTPSTAHVTFPNLRHVQCGNGSDKIRPLPPRQPFLSLVSVTIRFPRPAGSVWGQCLKWFSELSPNVSIFSAPSRYAGAPWPEPRIAAEHISAWQNLDIFMVPEAVLNIDALAHLSGMPTLAELSFRPTITIPEPFNQPLLFSSLRNMAMELPTFRPLVSMSKLLANIRLPAITDLTAGTADCPPGGVKSFLSALETATVNQSIMRLRFVQYDDATSGFMTTRGPMLTMDDLRHVMAFSNLRLLELDVNRHIDLTDDELVGLALGWPNLENLTINSRWRWGVEVVRGITPDAVFRILRTCPSLGQLCLAINTRGYIQVPPDRSPSTLTFKSRDKVCLNVVDSVLEQASVQAMVTFIVGIAPHAKLTLLYWCTSTGYIDIAWNDPLEMQEEYRSRWSDVHVQVDVLRLENDRRSVSASKPLG